LLLFSSVFSARGFSQKIPGGAEQFLLDAVNYDRNAAGLAPLAWDAELAAAARAHVRQLVEHDRLSHQFAGEPDVKDRVRAAGAHFSMVAENVAEAPSIDEMHIGWMKSAPHRANILNPKLTAIGIAVAKRGEEYFGVQDFSAAVGALTKEEQEKKVGALLRARGLRIAENPGDARKACDSSIAIPGVAALAIFHFEAPDLDRLPEQLGGAIKKGSYKTAAVGACSADESAGFSRFRIAVLLY
ncbi:MAG TPA: CAP domain-containing protein, partial [Candidatus Acidoferrum sp.]|nr:CAP domain-containing protein [Candidatus Acidoferrum sp.]